VEFNLNDLPDNAVHISGLRRENGRIEKLNAVSLVDTVFSRLPHLDQPARHNIKSVGLTHKKLSSLLRPHLPQPANEPNSVAFLPLFRDYIQPYQQSAGPTQHQICGLAQ
jgi:hypothetical protein